VIQALHGLAFAGLGLLGVRARMKGAHVQPMIGSSKRTHDPQPRTRGRGGDFQLSLRRLCHHRQGQAKRLLQAVQDRLLWPVLTSPALLSARLRALSRSHQIPRGSLGKRRALDPLPLPSNRRDGVPIARYVARHQRRQVDQPRRPIQRDQALLGELVKPCVEALRLNRHVGCQRAAQAQPWQL